MSKTKKAKVTSTDLLAESAENSKIKLLQLELKDLTFKTVGAVLNTLDKYRDLCLFIRTNHVALQGTENQCLVEGGLSRSSASEIVKVALDTTKDQFEAFLKGEGFRVALKQAQEDKAPGEAPRGKKKRSPNSKVKGKSSKGSSARAADFNLFAKKLAIAANNLAGKGEMGLPWHGTFEGLVILIALPQPLDENEEQEGAE